MNTNDENLQTAILNLTHALRQGTPEERNEALQRCRTALESTLSQEDLIGLAIIIHETQGGLRVTTPQELEFAAKNEFHLHISWDSVLPSLASKHYISLKQNPACPDAGTNVTESLSASKSQNDDIEQLDHIVVLQLHSIEIASSEDSRSCFNSNNEYLMACLRFLDDVIERSQSESEENQQKRKRPSDGKELDVKYARLRSQGKASFPLPPLEMLCDALNLQKAEFILLLLALKAELDYNPIDVRTMVELLASDIVEQYEYRKLLEPDSTMMDARLIILDNTQRYGKVLVMMPREIVDYLITGGTQPPRVTEHISRSHSQGFRDNEHYLDAWLEISRILLGDLIDTPRSQARISLFKTGRNTLPASEIESIQQILHRIHKHGTKYPLGELIAKHHLDDNECIILSLALYVTIEKIQIPVDCILSLLAGEDPFRRVRYESYLAPDATLVREGIVQIRTGKQDESTLYIPHSQLRYLLELPQETYSLTSAPFFEHRSPEYTLDDVILTSDIRRLIDTAIASMRPEVLDRLRSWGISGSGSSNQLSMLFHGEPGTGKSLCASAVAQALKRTIMSVDAENILSKWHGESEQNLAQLFETYDQMAQHMQRPPVLLLEECEQLMARRDSIRGTAIDISEHRLTSILLEKLEAFSGILIGTSNLVDAQALDEAFSRRFQFKIRFPFPDAQSRYAIWQAHIPSSVPGRSAINFHAIADRYAFSGGQIRIASLCALRTSAIRGGHVTITDIIDACTAEERGSFEHHRSLDRNKIGFIQ